MARVVGMPCMAAVAGMIVMTTVHIMRRGSCCCSRGMMRVISVTRMIMVLGMCVVRYRRLRHRMRPVRGVTILNLMMCWLDMRMIVPGMILLFVLMVAVFLRHRALLPLYDSVRISRRFLTKPYGVSLGPE